MATKIKNKPNTTGLSCNCDSWLAHWEKYSKEQSYFCSVTNCYEKDLVGAHVVKAESFLDTKTYIVPLCKGHNNGNEVMEIFDSTKLVSADPKDTCG